MLLVLTILFPLFSFGQSAQDFRVKDGKFTNGPEVEKFIDKLFKPMEKFKGVYQKISLTCKNVPAIKEVYNYLGRKI